MTVKEILLSHLIFNPCGITAISTFVVAYITRNNGGLPVPIRVNCESSDDNRGGSCWRRIDIWSYVMTDGQPKSLLYLLTENFSVWFAAYSFYHVLTHVKPQRKLFHPFKFNPHYPSPSLIIKEIFRSARGVVIATLYEAFVNIQHERQILPLVKLPDIFQLPIPEKNGFRELNLIGFTISIIVLYLWQDFHFYWTHRMLHTKWLYKKVHKVHHESYNPGPFSGKDTECTIATM